jgi:hypothetical protein
MKINRFRYSIITLGIFISLLQLSCKKENDTHSTVLSIKFLDHSSDAELPTDTVTVSSDLSFSCKALVSPTENVNLVYLRIWFDYTKAVEYVYTPTKGSDLGYLIDPVTYDFHYSDLAGIINYVTIQVEAEDDGGTKHESHLSFRIQPVNFPFLFRFYDFRSSDTAAEGETVTIRPFFVPTTVNQTIMSMKVYRKTGTNQEELINTYSASDFFFYQTGFLREYEYQVPALPPGTRVVHRFELESSDGLRHVVQHMTLVK